MDAVKSLELLKEISEFFNPNQEIYKRAKKGVGRYIKKSQQNFRKTVRFLKGGTKTIRKS